MLSTRFWNYCVFREYDYSLSIEGSQFHLDGNGWYEPEYNYYEIGNGYSEESREDVDVNCIYYVKH